MAKPSSSLRVLILKGNTVIVSKETLGEGEGDTFCDVVDCYEKEGEAPNFISGGRRFELDGKKRVPNLKLSSFLLLKRTVFNYFKNILKLYNIITSFLI